MLNREITPDGLKEALGCLKAWQLQDRAHACGSGRWKEVQIVMEDCEYRLRIFYNDDGVVWALRFGKKGEIGTPLAYCEALTYDAFVLWLKGIIR